MPNSRRLYHTRRETYNINIKGSAIEIFLKSPRGSVIGKGFRFTSQEYDASTHLARKQFSSAADIHAASPFLLIPAPHSGVQLSAVYNCGLMQS